jgi:hypothetical protein
MDKPNIDKFKNTFEDAELIALLEISRLALADFDFFSWIAREMDVTDEELTFLQEKLSTYLNDDKGVK